MDKNLPERARPSKWLEVIGQDNTVKILKEQVKNKTGLSNAYIFCGNSGIGKTTLARLFFMALNCENLKDGNPCMECSSCKNMKYSLIEINASDKRGIDDMRELSQEMTYVGFTGDYKGVLLDEAHMLTKPAFNCLLKPMEDESKHGIWFICTTELSKIPKTIRTRCQVYKLNPIRWQDIFTRVQMVAKQEGVEISDDNLWKIARNSDNNLRQALHLLEKFSILKDMDKILSSDMNLNFLKALQTLDIKELWNILSSWSDEYEDIDQFLNYIKYDVSTCLKIKLGISLGQISPYKAEKYKKLTEYLTETKLTTALDIILKLQEKISGIYDYNSLFLQSMLKLKDLK